MLPLKKKKGGKIQRYILIGGETTKMLLQNCTVVFSFRLSYMIPKFRTRKCVCVDAIHIHAISDQSVPNSKPTETCPQFLKLQHMSNNLERISNRNSKPRMINAIKQFPKIISIFLSR